MSKCVTYHAFKDYITVCKQENEKASETKPETKPEKAEEAKGESAYVAPTIDYSKYGFSKFQ